MSDELRDLLRLMIDDARRKRMEELRALYFEMANAERLLAVELARRVRPASVTVASEEARSYLASVN